MAAEPTRSFQLFERASKVIPGGIYGHTSPMLTVPGIFPYYAARSKGCRYWDVDDREFIDFMCAYGPIILGYQHPEIEEAVEKQRALGNCFNHPSPVMVELAEELVSMIKFSRWAVFGKNGSDMTTWAIQVAREFTGKKKILTIHGSYHGSHPWSVPGHHGTIEEDKSHIHSFDWNDLNQFHDLIRKNKGNIAGFITTPFNHPLFEEIIMPEKEFFSEIQRTCRKEGIVFILDDIRAGFRLSLEGSHSYFGFEPDLICFSKAIANGYPLSATLGREELKLAASRVFLTGSFWNNAIPMVAAQTCLKILKRDSILSQIQSNGEYFQKELLKLAKNHSFDVTISGPPSMPFLTFKAPIHLYGNQILCEEAVRQGIFLHPHHHWFLSAAHNRNEIDAALQKLKIAFSNAAEILAKRSQDKS
jgi:glutamate-1-semialdehyde 2,1-aminomutase